MIDPETSLHMKIEAAESLVSNALILVHTMQMLRSIDSEDVNRIEELLSSALKELRQ